MLRSRGWALAWTVVRAAIVVLICVAVIAQAVESIGGAAADGRDAATTAVNFFSFFTILANISTALVMAWAVVWFFGDEDASPEPRSLALAIAAVSTYMIITGIVYNVLLRYIVLPQGGEPIWWSNEILHVVAPLFLLADVFVAPRRRPLRWSAIGAIVVFPIVWVVYTLIRGPLTTSPITGDPWWYPYPFLNPNNPGGYPSVAAYVAGISVAIALIAVFVVWMSRRRESPAVARAGAATPARASTG